MDMQNVAKVVELVLGVGAIVALVLGDVYSVEWSALVASTLGGLIGLMVKRPSDSLGPKAPKAPSDG